MQHQMDVLETNIQSQVQQLIENVSQKVAVIYHEEINSLNIQQKSFPYEQVFHQETSFEQLEMYLETCLINNVNIRVNDLLAEILTGTRDKILSEVFQSFTTISGSTISSVSVTIFVGSLM